MTRMKMKMMVTNMTITSILKVMATKVLRIKAFVIGKISNQPVVDEFLTFYVGNLYQAKCYQVKKAIQEAICLKTVPIVDQVVIAKTSKGESQGCAFVTARWDSYISINYYSSIETGDEIPDNPHAYNEFLQDLFCSKAGRARICDSRVLPRWPAVSAATSVSYEDYLSRKASIAKSSQSFESNCFIIHCIGHAILNHNDMMILSWTCQVLNLPMHNYQSATDFMPQLQHPRELKQCLQITRPESKFTVLRSCRCCFVQVLVNCFLANRRVLPRFSIQSFTQLAH